MAASHRQHDLNTHVLALMHQLSIDKDLVRTDTVANGICGIRNRCDLDLAPFLVRGHDLARRSEPLKLLVHALLLYTALTLDQGRC